MLLKQGDFQKRPSAPSPSVTASGRGSPFSRGCQVGPFPSWGCPGASQGPRGQNKGGVVAPGPAGMERRWLGGSATPQSQPGQGQTDPLPLPAPEAEDGAGDGRRKATLGCFYPPLSTGSAESIARSLALTPCINAAPCSDLHPTQTPSPGARPTPCSIPNLRDRSPTPSPFPVPRSADPSRNSAQTPPKTAGAAPGSHPRPAAGCEPWARGRVRCVLFARGGASTGASFWRQRPR